MHFHFCSAEIFQEIGGLLAYKDRMSSIECCAAPLGREVFERSMLYVFSDIFYNTNGKFGKIIIFSVAIKIDSCDCPSLKLF